MLSQTINKRLLFQTVYQSPLKEKAKKQQQGIQCNHAATSLQDKSANIKGC